MNKVYDDLTQAQKSIRLYFEMEQDKRIHRCFRFRDIESTTRGEFEPEEFEQIPGNRTG